MCNTSLGSVGLGGLIAGLTRWQMSGEGDNRLGADLLRGF